MLVGLGGNNGTTLMGGVIANKEGITWKTKEGVKAPNYWGSLTQASTCRVGSVNGKVMGPLTHSRMYVFAPRIRRKRRVTVVLYADVVSTRSADTGRERRP